MRGCSLGSHTEQVRRHLVLSNSCITERKEFLSKKYTLDIKWCPSEKISKAWRNKASQGCCGLALCHISSLNAPNSAFTTVNRWWFSEQNTLIHNTLSAFECLSLPSSLCWVSIAVHIPNPCKVPQVTLLSLSSSNTSSEPDGCSNSKKFDINSIPLYNNPMKKYEWYAHFIFKRLKHIKPTEENIMGQ